MLPRVDGHNFVVFNDGIYFVGEPTTSGFSSPDLTPTALRFLNFATGKASVVARLRTEAAYGMSISPDRRWALIPEYVFSGGDLMMVDNFR